MYMLHVINHISIQIYNTIYFPRYVLKNKWSSWICVLYKYPVKTNVFALFIMLYNFPTS